MEALELQAPQELQELQVPLVQLEPREPRVLEYLLCKYVEIAR